MPSEAPLLGVALDPVAVAVAIGLIAPLVAVVALGRRCPRRVTCADWITLGRVILAGVLAAATVLVFAGEFPPRTWTLALIVGGALLLDAIDGWVARRTRTATAAGARFDVEADAVLLLVLSVLASLTVGPWVLAMSVMRYLFVAASWVRPRLRRELAFSQARRVVAALQGVALLVVLLPVTPAPVGTAVAGVALALLAWSFARDIVALERGGP